MNEALRKALDDLEKAQDEMEASDEDNFLEPDPEDWFYTCAMAVVYAYADFKKGPAPINEVPFQTGVRFTLGEDGKTRIDTI